VVVDGWSSHGHANGFKSLYLAQILSDFLDFFTHKILKISLRTSQVDQGHNGYNSMGKWHNTTYLKVNTVRSCPNCKILVSTESENLWLFYSTKQTSLFLENNANGAWKHGFDLGMHLIGWLTNYFDISWHAIERAYF